MDEILFEKYINEYIEENQFNKHNTNKKYKILKEKSNKILEQYPNLQLIFEEDKELILDKTECKFLQKLISIYIDIYNLEEKENILLGCKLMYFYLNKIGLIEQK